MSFEWANKSIYAYNKSVIIVNSSQVCAFTINCPFYAFSHLNHHISRVQFTHIKDLLSFCFIFLPANISTSYHILIIQVHKFSRLRNEYQMAIQSMVNVFIAVVYTHFNSTAYTCLFFLFVYLLNKVRLSFKSKVKQRKKRFVIIKQECKTNYKCCEENKIHNLWMQHLLFSQNAAPVVLEVVLHESAFSWCLKKI